MTQRRNARRRPTTRRKARARPWWQYAPKGRKGILTAIALGLVFLVTLLVGLILQTVLWWLVTVLSGLGALAQRRALVMQAEFAQEQQSRRAHRGGPRPTGGPSQAPPDEPGQPGQGQAQGGAVRCTETREPIDDCACSSRHVATPEGARRFGRPLGSPLGRKSGKPRSNRSGATRRRDPGTPPDKPAPPPDEQDQEPPREPNPTRAPREPRIPTTVRARPHTAAPGRAMRRQA